ncbi:MAG: hypothetical protein E7573_02635 [Ruminococcaceae bacterium]|nr:hypothetical protein [Oscillospiraceae bacterium]
MKKLNKIKPIPLWHQIIWWAVRASLLIFGIYGFLHNSTTQFLMGIFAIAFTHLWDMFQLFGGKSFITRVSYQAQTMLNIFICFGVVIGYVLNTKTNFQYVDIIEHFISGVVASYFAYDFAVAFQGKSRHLSPGLAAFFSLCFSCFILVAWEFYEFTMDRLYGYTLQVSSILSEDGLVDTMIDMILAGAGSVLGMFWVAFSRNGVIGKNRKELRARVKAQSKLDRETELRYLEEND